MVHHPNSSTRMGWVLCICSLVVAPEVGWCDQRCTPVAQAGCPAANLDLAHTAGRLSLSLIEEPPVTTPTCPDQLQLLVPPAHLPNVPLDSCSVCTTAAATQPSQSRCGAVGEVDLPPPCNLQQSGPHCHQGDAALGGLTQPHHVQRQQPGPARLSTSEPRPQLGHGLRRGLAKAATGRAPRSHHPKGSRQNLSGVETSPAPHAPDAPHQPPPLQQQPTGDSTTTHVEVVDGKWLVFFHGCLFPEVALRVVDQLCGLVGALVVPPRCRVIPRCVRRSLRVSPFAGVPLVLSTHPARGALTPT